MSFKRNTNAFFLSDCFGFYDVVCEELGKKSLDDITAGDLSKHKIPFYKFLYILNYIKTRNDPPNASGTKSIHNKCKKK